MEHFNCPSYITFNCGKLTGQPKRPTVDLRQILVHFGIINQKLLFVSFLLEFLCSYKNFSDLLIPLRDIPYQKLWGSLKYKPVSLLQICGNWYLIPLCLFFEEDKLHNSNQSVFRASDSCECQLLSTVPKYLKIILLQSISRGT